MIRHIVFYRFGSEADLAAAEKMLLSMRGRVDTIRSMEVGRDFLGSERSYELALMVTLDSQAALTEYQNDDYHANTVKKFMQKVVKQSASVDYEL